MEDSTYKNQGSNMDDLIKPEPPLNQQQLANQSIVRKTIQKYQNKVSQMLKITQKQKKQNDNLKDQLKNLNEHLNNVINKVGHKNNKQHDENPREDVLRRQLDNQIKKNVALQKEVVQLRAKVKITQGTKLTQIHNEIRQKDKVIEELNNKIKTFQKFDKIDKNMDIYKRSEELTHKVNSLNQQVIHLKKKLNDQKKQEQLQQKSIKRQHEQIISLQTKYKTTQSMTGGKSPQKEHQNENNIINQFQKLKINFDSLENTKKANEKQLRFEIDNLKMRIKVLENQNVEFKDKLNRKQKETNILVSRMKQAQRKNNKTLQPLEIARKSEDFSVSTIFDQRKQYKGLTHLAGDCRKFDDSEQLTLQKNYKVKKFVFTWFEQHIISLDTIYELGDSSLKEISSFKISHPYQNIKMGELSLSEFEYIKEIEVYCSKNVQFLKIYTSREQVLQVGSERNYLKCKKFTFNIRTNEKPIAFLGVIQNRKGVNNQNKEVLISLGLEIKKKEILGKKFGSRPGRTESISKYPSKSAFGYNKNDKNIIQE